MVGRFDELGVSVVVVVGALAKSRVVGEAKKEMRLFRFLDGNGQSTAGMGFRSGHGEAHPVALGPGDPVKNGRIAEIQSPLQPAFASFENDAGFESGYEVRGILGAKHQTAPELISPNLGDHRVTGVVDLDQVFEFHGAIFAGRWVSVTCRVGRCVRRWSPCAVCQW